MRILSIETSHRSWQFALLAGEQTAFESRLDDRSLARNLQAEIDAACRQIGWRPHDLDAVVVDVGPGAFTGLRVGLTVAKSLAYALGCRLVTVSSLEVVAYQTAQMLGWPVGAQLITLVDALRGQWVQQTFRVVAPDKLQSAGPAQLASVDELLAPPPLPDRWWVGPGVESLARQSTEQQMPRSHRKPCLPSAVVLGQLGLWRLAAGATDDPLTLLPVYFRPSYAEKSE